MWRVGESHMKCYLIRVWQVRKSACSQTASVLSTTTLAFMNFFVRSELCLTAPQLSDQPVLEFCEFYCCKCYQHAEWYSTFWYTWNSDCTCNLKMFWTLIYCSACALWKLDVFQKFCIVHQSNFRCICQKTERHAPILLPLSNKCRRPSWEYSIHDAVKMVSHSLRKEVWKFVGVWCMVCRTINLISTHILYC